MRLVTLFSCAMRTSARVSLGRAGTAVTGSRVQELAADAPVQSDPPGNGVDIGVHGFAQGRHLVDETDLGGQERVGRVLDQLGAFKIGHHHGRLDEVEGLVQLAQRLLRPLRLDADDDPVRPHEVRQRRAFAQKLGVGGDIESRLRDFLP